MAEQSNPTQSVTLLQKLATLIGLLVGAALILPTLGGIFLAPSRLAKLEDQDRDKDRRISKVEQVTDEHGKAIAGMNTRMERLENVITNGNQRTEGSLQTMFEKLTELSAAARMMERSVQSAVDIANNAKATAGNAIIRADKALDEVETASRAK